MKESQTTPVPGQDLKHWKQNSEINLVRNLEQRYVKRASLQTQQ